MKTFILGVAVLMWSGCVCGPKNTEEDFGTSCLLADADSTRVTRQPFEYVTPIRAVECVEGACIGNALPDGGVVDHPELGYCSRTCTANADCVATAQTSGAGECRPANAPDAGNTRYCWYQ